MAIEARTSALARALIADNFGASAGVLVLGGVEVTALAEAVGTPLFAYDANLLRRSYRRLTAAVAGFAEVYYSIKANPNPEVARVLVAAGAGAEIASAGEYVLARRAGAEPARILFAGPGKTEDALHHVVAAGIGEIHVESEAEIERLTAVARRVGRSVAVSIRVNPVSTGQGGSMVMGGRASQFGIDEERFLAVADTIEERPELELRGIHMFAGTQILDADILERQWAHGLDVAGRLAAHLGRPLETIDLGGGLGIPYFAGDRRLDLGRVSAIAATLNRDRAGADGLRSARIILEPGRFLAGEAGIYVTRVVEVKVSRGERFVITDGGMNHHLAASGNLGQVIKRDYPVVAANRLAEPEIGAAAVVGPLCTPLDAIARRTELPELVPGDLIAVLQSGAYGLSASPVGFLSHPTPAEVLVDDGTYRLLRRHGSYAMPTVGLDPEEE